MKYKMPESLLYCYNLIDKTVLLINDVSGNKQGFFKRKINGVEQAKHLHATLMYPSVKYIMWIVQIHQIVDFPVTVQDIDIIHTIWGGTLRI